MMGLYLIKRTDGGVAIMRTVTDDTNPAKEIEKWHPKERSSVLSIHPITEADVPTDRYFRNAWSHSDGGIHVDMPKAREIHRETLRRRRKPLLDALDTDYMRADETGSLVLKAQIALDKQALRDVTKDPRIDKAATPEELKAIIPAILTAK